MGLLDFARDVGRPLFDTDAEAADKIKQHFDAKLTGISNVEVEFDDGVATICDNCRNQAVKDNAIPIAGNIRGVKRVIGDGLNAHEAPNEEVNKDTLYEIRSGDTLGAIAARFCGKASQYLRIFEANRDMFDNPNKNYPGQQDRDTEGLT